MPWTVSDVDRFKRGLSAAQKRRWVRVANSALRSCLDNGGQQRQCEASAIRQANGVVGNQQAMEQLIQTNRDYQIRTEHHRGRRHLVVPVVMMREGVHNGSHGPLYYTIEELGRYVEAWNGIPVVVYHPQRGGQYVSANDPELTDRIVVGTVYNTHVEGDKLKAEAWLDESKLSQVSPLALAAIRQGRPLDVSIGAFTDDDASEGTWNGEHYVAIARNPRPDHLALLPGEQGACSWQDGCGVRLNKKGGDGVSSTIKFTKQPTARPFEADIMVNQDEGLMERARAVQSALDAMDTNVKVHYLEELWDDYLVYRIAVEGEGSEYYKQNYTLNEDGSVEFTDTPTEVRKRVEFVAVQKEGGEFKRTKFNSNSKKEVKMAEEKKTCCPEKVDALIANDKTTFTEDDKDWLLTLSEEQFEKVSSLGEVKEDPPEDPEVNANDDDENPEPKEQKITAQQALEALKESFKTPEDFIKVLPKEIQEEMSSGLKLHRERKATMIKEVLANTSDTWSQEELAEMDAETLSKLYRSTKREQADYSPLGGGVSTNKQQGEEPLYPTGKKIEN